MARLKASLFGVAAFLLSWAALEAILWIGDPWLLGGAYQYDGELGMRMRPGMAGRNKLGFNDGDHPLEKKPGTFRIAIIGDSFSHVGGRKMNYAHILQRRLDEAFGPGKIEIMNAGYPCTGPLTYAKIFKKDILPYKPDMLLVGFFLGNDFSDDAPGFRMVSLNGAATMIRDPGELLRVGPVHIILKSRLAHFLNHHLKIIEDRMRNPEAKKIPGSFSQEQFLKMEAFKIDLCLRSAFKGGDRPPYSRALQSLSDILAAARRNGVEPHVGMYPPEYMVSAKLYGQILKFNGRKGTEYDFMQPRRVLAGYLKSENTPYLDMTPAFQKEGRAKELYIPRNTHWNDEGNRLAADLWFEYLSRLPSVRRAGMPV